MTRLTAMAALDRHFLEARGKILEIAAILDRVDRGDGAQKALDEARLAKIRQALAILQGPETGRAERVQMLFSIPHESK